MAQSALVQSALAQAQAQSDSAFASAGITMTGSKTVMQHPQLAGSNTVGLEPMKFLNQRVCLNELVNQVELNGFCGTAYEWVPE
jgi:hypothetical protein